MNGGVACVWAEWRVFGAFWARFYVRFCASFSADIACRKARLCAELCQMLQAYPNLHPLLRGPALGCLPRGGANFPKDPALLKILRRSKFTMRSTFSTAQRCTMATPLVWTSFSLVLQASLLPKEGSQHSKSGGHSKNTTHSKFTMA